MQHDRLPRQAQVNTKKAPKPKSPVCVLFCSLSYYDSYTNAMRGILYTTPKYPMESVSFSSFELESIERTAVVKTSPCDILAQTTL
jgi:hypothetical protein